MVVKMLEKCLTRRALECSRQNKKKIDFLCGKICFREGGNCLSIHNICTSNKFFKLRVRIVPLHLILVEGCEGA